MLSDEQFEEDAPVLNAQSVALEVQALVSRPHDDHLTTINCPSRLSQFRLSTPSRVLSTYLRPLHSLLPRKHLQASDMRILSILMILQDTHLQTHAPQRPTLPPSLLPLHALHPAHAPPTHARQRHLDPAGRLLAAPLGELDEVVGAGAGGEDDAGGRVALVELEVEVHAQADDADALEEVQREQVRLRAVRLPELVHRRRLQRRHPAPRLVRADGPAGERGDLAQVRRERWRGWRPGSAWEGGKGGWMRMDGGVEGGNGNVVGLESGELTV